MKKLQIGCLLGLLSMSLLPSAAFAETAEKHTKDVKATYTETSEEEIITSVDIQWGSLAFTYEETKVWNPKTHIYETGEAGGWTTEANGDQITIVNHSNRGLNVAVETSTEAAFAEALSITTNQPKIVLASAAEAALHSPESAPSETATVEITGTLAPTVADSTIIGHVTVRVD